MTVLVVGNATLDLSFEVFRLPRPGETLLADDRRVDAGGKGLNQALVAHRCGVPVRFLAPIGDDADGSLLRQRLEAEALPTDHLITRPGDTDQSIIWIAADGENVIVSTAARSRGLAGDEALTALDGLGAGDVLLMQGNLSLETTRAWLRRGRERGLHTVLNPAPIHFAYDDLWPYVSLAVLNRGEARELGGGDDPATAAASLRRAGVETVIITLGGEGLRWFGPDGEGSLPATPVRAVDTTGAGDVFCGVLAAGLHRGLALPIILPAAIAAAGLSVTRRGTASAFPHHHELRAIQRDAGWPEPEIRS